LFLQLTIVFAFSTLMISYACCSCILLRSLACLQSEEASLSFGFAMARVRSTERYVGGAAIGGYGGNGGGPEERTRSTQLSDAGSCTKAGDAGDESVRRIHVMVDDGYFVDGMGREPERRPYWSPMSMKL
jgi:hypothetical protein